MEEITIKFEPEFYEMMRELFGKSGELPAPEVPVPYLIDLNNLPAGTKIVTVTKNKGILREWYDTNARGFPIWGIFGKSEVANRIIAKIGKKLVVTKDAIKGDGGHYALEIAEGQVIDGTYMYRDVTETYRDVNQEVFTSPKRRLLYILKEDVE